MKVDKKTPVLIDATNIRAAGIKILKIVGEFYSNSLNSKPRLENGTRKKTLV